MAFVGSLLYKKMWKILIYDYTSIKINVIQAGLSSPFFFSFFLNYVPLIEKALRKQLA